MDRILVVGGTMMAVGVALAGFWFFIFYHGTTFERIEDTVVRWLGGT
jgi:hypothetical protein